MHVKLLIFSFVIHLFTRSNNFNNNIKSQIIRFRFCILVTQRVTDEKDLGVIFSSKLQWNVHINQMVSKAKRQLGVLKRTCYSLTSIKIRHTFYLSLVKIEAIHHKFCSQFTTDNSERRATDWILRTRTSEMTYKQQLLKLKLLPLSYDQEIKDLVLFFKAVYGYVDLSIDDCVCFIQHGRTRLSQATGITLHTFTCRTATFQLSYFNHIVLGACVHKTLISL